MDLQALMEQENEGKEHGKLRQLSELYTSVAEADPPINTVADQVPINTTQNSQVSVANNPNNKGKEPAVIPDAPEDGQKYKGKKRGRKPVAKTPSYGRIYHKNRGRSERIANQYKKFKFDEFGTGSTPDKAFSVDDDDE